MANHLATSGDMVADARIFAPILFLLYAPAAHPLTALSPATPTPFLVSPETNYINPSIHDLYPLAFSPPTPRPANVPKDSPPPTQVLQIPNFLTPSECSEIIKLGNAVALTGAECDEYLNARVNTEVSTTGSSLEAKSLIDEHLEGDGGNIDESAGGGYRVRLDESDVKAFLESKLKFVMGLEERVEGFYFEEGAWERPTPRRIVIRDQTMVKYENKNGVPPHVDGKDATLLIYLNSVHPENGGRTVFPEDGLAVQPVEGTALLYKSKTELLHFSEPVRKYDGREGDGEPTKYILQLLIDYEHDYKKGDMVTDFRRGTSYIYK